MGMYLDTVVGKHMRKVDIDQFFLWMDNYKAHNTEYVKNKMESMNVTAAFFPSNMTAQLQVCDLHVNGPIKRKTRSMRALRTFQAFQLFLADYEKMSNVEKKLAKFRPPKPTLEEGLNDIIEVFSSDGDFGKKTFQEGQTKCFVSTGCVPMHSDEDVQPFHELMQVKVVSEESRTVLDAIALDRFFLQR